MIMKQFKMHAREESARTNTDHNANNSDKFTELTKNQPLSNSPSSVTKFTPCEFHLQYLGSLEVASTIASAEREFIDSALAQFKEAHSKKRKQKRKHRKTSGGKGMGKRASTSSSSVDSIDFANHIPAKSSSTTSELSEGSESNPFSPTSSVDRQSQSPGITDRHGTLEEDGTDVAIRLTRATPEREVGKEKEEEEEESKKLLPEISKENVNGVETAQEVDRGGGSPRELEEVDEPDTLEGEASSGRTREEEVGSVNPEFPLNQETLSEGGVGEVATDKGTSQTADVNSSTATSHREDIPQPHPERPRSLYETKEIMFMIGDKQEEEREQEEVVRPTGRRRSLTVLSESGTVLSSGGCVIESTKNKASKHKKIDAASKGVRSEVQEKGIERNSLCERTESSVRVKRNMSFEDFDALPELDALQQSSEFKALGKPVELPSKSVRLVFSGFSVSVISEKKGERLLRKTIRTIACAGQVGTEGWLSKVTTLVRQIVEW